MTAYFARRMLLMIPTFLGVTMLVFLITRIVPGGPLDTLKMQMQMGMGGRGGGAAVGQIPEEQLKELKRELLLDLPVHEAYIKWLSKTLTGDFGNSFFYREPVLETITRRFPISMYFGLLGYLISYLVSIPLGIAKALRHGAPFDYISSAVVFIGYSIPGWALGAVLLVLFAGGQFWQIFPLGGFKASSYDSLPEMVKKAEDPAKLINEDKQFDWGRLSARSKFIDLVWHTFLPVLCYAVGSFASLTMLTKNSLLENIGADYVRTAFAKGLSPMKVIYQHTLRNSLIPVATGLGHVISLVLAGSFLIETVFNIDGMGLLGYQSILRRDYAVTMGILSIAILLTMVGNLLSDLLYALIDPRIRFE